MNTTTELQHDMKTEEGVKTAAQAVLSYLGPHWLSEIRGFPGRWYFVVSPSEQGNFCEIFVTNDHRGTGHYTAEIEMPGYREESTAEGPVGAVKALQESIKKRIDLLQSVHQRITT
jgi:hypothetical protein